jgi:ribosomal protein S18 acetylase RimI-like enzyme
MIADLKTSEKNLYSKRAARGKTGACGCFDFVRATLYSPPRPDVITIRPVTPDDFSAVKRMFQDILPNADYTKEYPEFAYVERAFVNWKLDFSNGGDMHLFFEETPEDRRLFIAELKGVLVGMGGVILSQGHAADLVRMGVTERTRKLGIATSLLAACEGWAREQGKTEMVLGTWTINVTAQKFYEHNGYQRVGKIQFDLVHQFERLGLHLVDGLTMDRLVSWEMKKNLWRPSITNHQNEPSRCFVLDWVLPR